MEEVRTQNVLGNHITDEINRNIENTDARATEIKQKIDNHNTYVVNTIQPQTDRIDDIETTVNTNTSKLNEIWEKVKNITHWI